MKNEQAQRQIIAAAFFSIMSADLLPNAFEQQLAEKYIQGSLTMYQSVELLEAYNRQQGRNVD